VPEVLFTGKRRVSIKFLMDGKKIFSNFHQLCLYCECETRVTRLAAMALTQILPSLYIGNQFSTTVTEVDVIISIGCNSKCRRNVATHKLSIRDSQDSDITEILTTAASLIDDYLSEGKSVLVHCKGGINRSPMVVVAYLWPILPV
jgi:hypothetical protein